MILSKIIMYIALCSIYMLHISLSPTRVRFDHVLQQYSVHLQGQTSPIILQDDQYSAAIMKHIQNAFNWNTDEIEFNAHTVYPEILPSGDTSRIRKHSLNKFIQHMFYLRSDDNKIRDCIQMYLLFKAVYQQNQESTNALSIIFLSMLHTEYEHRICKQQSDQRDLLLQQKQIEQDKKFRDSIENVVAKQIIDVIRYISQEIYEFEPYNAESKRTQDKNLLKKLSAHKAIKLEKLTNAAQYIMHNMLGTLDLPTVLSLLNVITNHIYCSQEFQKIRAQLQRNHNEEYKQITISINNDETNTYQIINPQLLHIQNFPGINIHLSECLTEILKICQQYQRYMRYIQSILRSPKKRDLYNELLISFMHYSCEPQVIISNIRPDMPTSKDQYIDDISDLVKPDIRKSRLHNEAAERIQNFWRKRYKKDGIQYEDLRVGNGGNSDLAPKPIQDNDEDDEDKAVYSDSPKATDLRVEVDNSESLSLPVNKIENSKHNIPTSLTDNSVPLPPYCDLSQDMQNAIHDLLYFHQRWYEYYELIVRLTMYHMYHYKYIINLNMLYQNYLQFINPSMLESISYI